MKLEAEEIGDKEAEESPVDDEEEEETNEESLQDKEKRKEKIKQLLQIKKKKAEEKENESKETGEKQRHIKEFVHGNESQIKETAKEAFIDGKLKENEKCDAAANDDEIEINNEQSKLIEGVHTISDDSSKVASEVDELNLLQKLHSENEMNTSTIESTDTDTPIDISDSLTSGDNTKKNANDVISIENSSYSESEINKDVDDDYVKEILPIDNNNVEEDILPTITTSIELGDLNVVPDDQARNYVPQTSNDEYNDSIGNILLASSEDELADKDDNDLGNEESSMNLQDDNLSIGDTVVQEGALKNVDDLQSQCNETNENNNTEQLAQEDNTSVSSCGEDVLEKQGKRDGDAIGDTIDIFSSFDKNSEESVTSVKSADQLVEDENEIIQKEYNPEKAKINVVTEIMSDPDSLDKVHVRQSSNYDVQEDIEMLEAEDNIVNNMKDVKNSELTAVVPSNKEIEMDDTEPVMAESMEIVHNDVVLEDTTKVGKSNIPSNIAASDSVLTKDDAKVSNIERTEDSLDALLEELNSDLSTNK